MSTSTSSRCSRTPRVSVFRSLTALVAVFAFAATSNAGLSDCGQPKSSGTKPVSGDALYVLQSAVKTATCDLCVCDVNRDLKLAASDALLTLKKAVGQDVALDCPGCIGTLVFTSSVPYQGNLGGLAGADAKCTQLANQAGFAGKFQAWLSDGTDSARTRLGGTSGPFTLIDGTVIASSPADLMDGSIAAEIWLSEKGTTPQVKRVWTSSDVFGAPCYQSSDGDCQAVLPQLERTSCNNWTDIEGTDEAVTGIGAGAGEWTAEGTRACSDYQSLYCVAMSPCATNDDCVDSELSCVGTACSDGYCRGIPAPKGTPCETGGELETCGYPDRVSRGVCNSDEQSSAGFSFTGEAEHLLVPPGVTNILVTAKGAQGGVSGGKGGMIRATVAVVPGDVLSVYVGGHGRHGVIDEALAYGGFNGGGNGGTSTGGITYFGAGGGGASDVRLNGDALEDRIIVAGGGGGSWTFIENSGGAGGGSSGGAGSGTVVGAPGGGATQSAGGTGGGHVDCDGEAGVLGQGGRGAATPSQSICAAAGGGGGGGGYYGGGGGGAKGSFENLEIGGGGGGSSWVIPGATDVTTESGVREGDGEVVIEW